MTDSLAAVPHQTGLRLAGQLVPTHAEIERAVEFTAGRLDDRETLLEARHLRIGLDEAKVVHHLVGELR